MDMAATVLSAIGVILTFVGVAWKMTKDIRDEHKNSYDEHKKDVSRVYERFDEFKKNIESTHVSKEVFSLTYSGLIKDIGEIKSDVKALLGRGKED